MFKRIAFMLLMFCVLCQATTTTVETKPVEKPTIGERLVNVRKGFGKFFDQILLTTENGLKLPPMLYMTALFTALLSYQKIYLSGKKVLTQHTEITQDMRNIRNHFRGTPEPIETTEPAVPALAEGE